MNVSKSQFALAEQALIGMESIIIFLTLWTLISKGHNAVLSIPACINVYFAYCFRDFVNWTVVASATKNVQNQSLSSEHSDLYTVFMTLQQGITGEVMSYFTGADNSFFYKLMGQIDANTYLHFGIILFVYISLFWMRSEYDFFLGRRVTAEEAAKGERSEMSKELQCLLSAFFVICFTYYLMHNFSMAPNFGGDYDKYFWLGKAAVAGIIAIWKLASSY
mmetsp:Transcript_21061/g.23830  ORF Transcript_21061/g.23830 Transcript_21061/m.23830 type:complete len:220 (+) Transcript_21061:1-660(+)